MNDLRHLHRHFSYIMAAMQFYCWRKKLIP